MCSTRRQRAGNCTVSGRKNRGRSKGQMQRGSCSGLSSRGAWLWRRAGSGRQLHQGSVRRASSLPSPACRAQPARAACEHDRGLSKHIIPERPWSTRVLLPEETQSLTTALVLPRVPVWTLLLHTDVPERQSTVGFKAALDTEARRIYCCLHAAQLTQVLRENSLLIPVVESLSCARLCIPMDCSTPGFPVLYHLPEFAQIQVH